MEQFINRQMLLNFILNEVSEEQHKSILNEIENDEITRGRYIQIKRKFDVERLLNNEMSVGEKIKFQEIMKEDSKLKEYFNLSKNIEDFLKIEVFKEQIKRTHEELFGSERNIKSFN